MNFGVHLNLSRNAVAQSVLLEVQVMLRLEFQPELGRRVEVAGQAQRRIGRDAPSARDNLVDPARIDADIERQPMLTQPQRRQKLLLEDFTGMDRIHLLGFIILEGLDHNLII